MLRSSSVVCALRPLLRPFAYLLRDLAPWLVRAFVGWLLARLGNRMPNRPAVPCQDCPFSTPDPVKPAAPENRRDVPGGTAPRSAALFLLGLGLLPLLAGGCTPTASYVQAERATYDAIAPEYASYIDADPSLDPPRRARRHRTLAAWRIRLETAESQTRR